MDTESVSMPLDGSNGAGTTVEDLPPSQPAGLREADLPEMLTVDEAAAYLRVDRKSIYSAIKDGDVPGVFKLGRCIRLHRATFLAWLHQGRSGRR